MTKRILSILVLVSLVLSVVPVFVPTGTVMAAVTLRDSYETGVSQTTFFGVNWRGQTFNATATYEATQVRIYIKQPSASPSDTITISLRNVDGEGKPTGADLGTGTLSCASVTSSYQWLGAYLDTAVSITTGTQYAVVARTTATSSYSVWWQQDGGGGYGGGSAYNSADAGSTWTIGTGDDRLFRVYSGYDVPAGATDAPTLVTNTTATLNGEITDIGAPSCNVSFQYYKSGGTWTDNETTPEVITSTGGVDQGIAGLDPGAYYYFRIKMVNGGGTAYGSSATIRTPDHSIGEIDSHIPGSTINLNPERKLWYAKGRYWAFYSDGTNMVYRTSVDGTTWGSKATIGTADSGDDFSTYFDNQYLYYVRSGYFRRGIPNTDGTITWSASEQYVGALTHPTITVDTEGYPYIGYSAGMADTGYVVKSSVNTGYWNTASGYPVNVYDDDVDPKVSILPLANGKMYAVGITAGGILQGRYYNGSAWGSIEGISGAVTGICWGHTAVALGDDVYVAFTSFGGANPNDQLFYHRDSDGNWTGPTLLFDLNDNTEVCNLAIDSVSNAIYAFISVHTTYGAYTENHIYYKMYVDDAWGGATDWITDSEGLETDGISHLSAMYRTTGGYLGVIYLAGTASSGPYVLKFANLEVGMSPEVSTDYAASIGQTSAILQGTLVNDNGSACGVRFQWGLSTSYGVNTAWDWGSGSGYVTDDPFQYSLTGLTPNTTYHYRAQAKWADGTTASGIDRTFTTASLGNPTVSTGSAASITQSSATIQGTVTSMGDQGTVYVYFEWGLTTGYEQSPTSEETKTITGGFSSPLTGLSASTTYYFRAVLRYGSTTIYGAQGSFVTTASSGAPGIDLPDVFRIDDVKVYTGFRGDNDQLYVISYWLLYTAGDPIGDVGDYFDLVLMEGTIVRAKVPVSSWGYRPGSIYLAAASAPAWGGEYTIRLQGNPGKWGSPPPYQERVLTAGDWQGADLLQLDTWVLSTARSLQNYYDSVMVTFAGDGTIVLSEQGGVIFNMGILGLCRIRPHLCTAMSYWPDVEPREKDLVVIDPEERLGPEVHGVFVSIAQFFDVETGTAGTILFVLGYIVLVIGLSILLRSLGTASGLVSMGLASPMLIMGTFWGFIPYAFLTILTGIVAAYVFYLIWATRT